MHKLIILYTLCCIIGCSSDRSTDPKPAQIGLIGTWQLVSSCTKTHPLDTVCTEIDINNEYYIIFHEDSTFSRIIFDNIEKFGHFEVKFQAWSERESLLKVVIENLPSEIFLNEVTTTTLELEESPFPESAESVVFVNSYHRVIR